MRIIQNKEIAYQEVWIRESVDFFSSEVTIVTPQPLQDKSVIIEQGGKSADFKIINAEKLDALTFKYKLISVNYYKHLNTTFPCFEGLATTEELANLMGITQKSYSLTQKVKWDLPQLKINNLLLALAEGTNFAKGGGVSLFFDISGDLKILDYRSIFQFNPLCTVEGLIVKDVINTEWITRIPGIINIISYTENGIETEKLELKQGFSEGTYRGNGDVARVKNLLANEFWRRYYRSRVISLTSVISAAVSVGALVKFRDENFMVLDVDSRITKDSTELNIKISKCA